MSGEIVRRRERTRQKNLGPATDLDTSLRELTMAFERAGQAVQVAVQQMETSRKITTGEVIDVEYREVKRDDDE